MKTCAITIFAALLTTPLLSQQAFRPGYIVQPTGDTLRGEVKVNEKKPLELYTKVTFRDASGVQKMYKPAKIKAYGVDGNNFVALKENEDAAFYRLLAVGHVSLLEWKYEGLRMNKPFVETEYFLMVQGNKFLEPVKEKNFRKQAQSVMADNSAIATEYPADKQFDPEAAASVINAYNAWKSGATGQ